MSQCDGIPYARAKEVNVDTFVWVLFINFARNEFSNMEQRYNGNSLQGKAEMAVLK